MNYHRRFFAFAVCFLILISSVASASFQFSDDRFQGVFTTENIDKIIEEYDGEYSGEYMDGVMPHYSRARGRGARRDSRGRYSSRYSREGRDGYSREYRDGYSGHDMIGELKELMEDAPDERTRMEFDKFIRKMETM